MEHRADLRAGLVAATVLNLFRGKDDPLVKPGDFFTSGAPTDGASPGAPVDPEQHVNVMKLKVAMINALFGGQDLRERQ